MLLVGLWQSIELHRVVSDGQITNFHEAMKTHETIRPLTVAAKTLGFDQNAYKEQLINILLVEAKCHY